MKKHAKKSQIVVTKAILMLCCALLVGCELHGTYPNGPVVVFDDHPPVIVTTPATSPLLGTIAITAFSPMDSAFLTETDRALVTVRSGSAFGPVVIEPTSFFFDEDGLLSLDIVDLPYGYYDIEMVGLDIMGNNVSYAASGLTLNEPIESLSLSLEQIHFSGDVFLDISEPTWDAAVNPVNTIDYTLWDQDPLTGELTFVEYGSGLFYDGLSMPMIADLEFGQYHLDVQGFDVFGTQTVSFAGDFEHSGQDTLVLIDFWYSW